MITHKPFEFFEFHQLEQLLEIMCTVGVILTQEKFNNSGGWLDFDGLVVV